MPVAIMIATDLAAICLMAFCLYFGRHRRRDLAVAFIGVNVGVLAVSVVLDLSIRHLRRAWRDSEDHGC